MDKNDLQRLDTERAKISVSVQGARDLVSQWLGDSFDDNDEETPTIVTLTSSTHGLGYKPEKAAAPQNTALERLKRTHKHAISDSKNNTKNESLRGRSKPPALTKPVFAKPESDVSSESEGESRTTMKTQKRVKSSALDAYKQRKKKKSK